jgi:regulatory protein
MYKVKSLEKKRKNYLIVFEDETSKNYDFVVSEDIIIEFRLVTNKSFDKEQYNKIISEIKRDEFYQKVLNYAMFKPRTKHEIILYLQKFHITDFNYYLNKLIRLRLIDDDLYLKNYIEESINFKRIGPNKIFNDLKNKGLNYQEIKDRLQLIDSNEWLKNINYWFEKKLNSLKKKSFLQSKKTIMNFLVTKGFYYEDIMNIINENQGLIQNSIDEESSIKKEVETLKKHFYKRQIKGTLHNYIVNKLLAKGYQYKLILKCIEGSNIDE